MSKESDSLIKNSFDGVLNRIGFGFYQIYALIPLGLLCFVDATLLTGFAILEEALVEEFNLEDWQLAFLTSVAFIGTIVGAFIGGTFSDVYGRLLIVNLAAWGLLVFGVILVFMPEYYSFLVIRGLIGLSSGLNMTVWATYGSEICPVEYRGAYMIVLQSFFTLGQIYIVGITYLLMPGLEDTGKFRELLFISVMPMFFACALLLFVMEESPRFLAKKQKVVEAIEVLNTIARYNKADPLNYDEEKIVGSLYPLSIDDNSKRISILFDKRHIFTTIKFIVLWVVAVFTFYGFFFILPLTISDQNDGNTVQLGLLIATLTGIPSSLFNAIIIENDYFGRKKTTIFSLIGQVVFLALAGALYKNEGLIVSAAMVIFFSHIWFCTLYPYTCEVHETEIRGMALGYLNATGRLGGAVAPLILIYLHQLSASAPHYFMSLISLIALGFAWKLPIETRGRQLDKAIN